MNSTSTTMPAMTEVIIQEAYESYVSVLVLLSALTLSFYTTLMALSQEKEHIWSRSFSLPTLLYICARYGNLVCEGLSLLITFTPLGGTCNVLNDVLSFISLLPYIGTQGLLAIRAYSVCRGNKILGSALGFGVVSPLALELYGAVGSFTGCSLGSNAKADISSLIVDIITVGTDLLIFGICMWNVWGTWSNLKSNNGIRINTSLTSVILTQSILRCCFVITITVTGAIILWFKNTIPYLFAISFTFMQQVLSATLVADFTLDLRRLNSSKIESSQMSLPSLQLSNVLQHVEQSFLVEMSTPEERSVEEGVRDNNSGHLTESTGDIQHTEL